METALNNTASVSWISSPLEAFRIRRKNYLVYRRTIRELSNLSDRDLADLGLSRSMIRSLAHEAAYGN